MRIGIDLGGTKIELVVLDDDGAIRKRQRIATAQGDYSGILNSILGLVQAAEHEFEQSMSVGIGTPGAVSPVTSLLRNSNSVCLNQKPLRQDLEHLLQREIRLANDADCFALSEAIDGAGQGSRTVFGIIIGTGVGGGIVVDKQLLSGPNAIAGEWGHNPMPWPEADEYPGINCYCGRTGCIETFLSGAGMVETYAGFSGQKLEPPQIVALADSGNATAQQVIQLYARRLAKAIAQVINILDPDVVVLGGGMSNIDYWYDIVPGIWGDYVFCEQVQTRLCKAHHGDSGGVRGAAWLWPQTGA